MRIGNVGVIETGKRLLREVGDDDISGLAAELSYRFFLALFPFAIFLAAVWAASGGMAALIKAMNRAYDIPETRPFWKRTLLAVGLTVAGGVAVLLAFSLMVTLSVAAGDIADALDLGTPFEIFLQVARF